MVLKNNSLGKQLEGNVLRIATNKTLEDEETQRKRLNDARMLAAEVQTETRVLSYAKAADLSVAGSCQGGPVDPPQALRYSASNVSGRVLSKAMSMALVGVYSYQVAIKEASAQLVMCCFSLDLSDVASSP